MLQRIALLLLLSFALVGCSGLNVQPNGDGTATITVSLTESEINTVIATALSTAEEPVLSNTSVDLQTGQIVVSGDYQRQDGTGTASGTLTLQISVVNGEIQAQVSNVNIEGLDASDARIQQFNERLETGLATVAQQNNANASLDSITITDDTLNIAITVQTPQLGN